MQMSHFSIRHIRHVRVEYIDARVVDWLAYRYRSGDVLMRIEPMHRTADSRLRGAVLVIDYDCSRELLVHLLGNIDFQVFPADDEGLEPGVRELKWRDERKVRRRQLQY